MFVFRTNLFSLLRLAAFELHFSNLIFNPFRNIRNGIRNSEFNGQNKVLKWMNTVRLLVNQSAHFKIILIRLII